MARTISDIDTMAEVMTRLALHGVDFSVTKEGDKKLALYTRDVSLNRQTMAFLSKLDSRRFFVSILRGDLTVKEV